MESNLISQNSAISIKQHNALTEARYEMSVLQKNIFYLLLAQLEDEGADEKKYKLSLAEVNKSRNIRVRREELRKAARGLMSTGLTLYSYDQKSYITIGILHSADYGTKEDKENLIIEFDSKLYPFLYNVKRRFTTFTLQNALNLKSKYSKRIYEMLCQYKDTGIFKISVIELKNRFELINLKNGKDTYPKFGLFAAKVLEVAKKEINDQTDINFTYTTKKTGKKITDLEFHINYNPTIKNSNIVEPTETHQKESTVNISNNKYNISKEHTYTKLTVEEYRVYESIITSLGISKSSPTSKIVKDKKALAYKLVKTIPLFVLSNKVEKFIMSFKAGKTTISFSEYLKQILIEGAQKKLPTKSSSFRPVEDIVLENPTIENEGTEERLHQDFSNKKEEKLVIDSTKTKQTPDITSIKDLIQSHFKFSVDKEDMTEPTKFSSEIQKDNLKLDVYKKLSQDFGITFRIVDKIVAQVPVELIQEAIDTISKEIEEKNIKDKTGYALKTLKNEFKIKVTSK